MKRSSVVSFFLSWALFLGSVYAAWGQTTDSSAPRLLNFDAVFSTIEIPSGSDLSHDSDYIYVIGDDSQYLFKLDHQFNIIVKTLLKPWPQHVLTPNGRISHDFKPDIESMANCEWEGETWRIFLGSGSKSPFRETVFLMHENGIKKIENNLTPFFRHIAALGKLNTHQQLNIEGFALSPQHAYLLNRGNSASNLIFKFDRQAFLQHVFDPSKPIPTPHVYGVSLPKVSGFEAGFSGATLVPDSDWLIFTASIEATRDALCDGETLGSFVGAVRLSELRDGTDLSPVMAPTKHHGEWIRNKIEGVTIMEQHADSVSGVFASDNDNGATDFFRFKLALPH